MLGIRPGDLPWFNADTEETAEQQKSERVHEAEARLADYANRLLGGLPEDRTEWSNDDRMRELVYQFLDFHSRADKPSWWAMFSRQEMTEEEFIEEPEAIGGLVADLQWPADRGEKP